MTLVEVERVTEAVVSRLKADATLLAVATGGVHYAGLVPRLVAYPFVDVSDYTATDVIGLGGVRLAQNTQVLVRWFDRGTGYTKLRQIGDRIDTLLHGYSVKVSGVEVRKMVRTSTPPLPPEVDGDVVYVRRQAIYDSVAHAA